MIDNILPYLADPDEVRNIILKQISGHTKEELKTVSHSELASLRRKTSDVTGSCIDAQGHVYMPDEINPVALMEQFITEKEYTASKEMVLAVICRAMVAPINESYSAAAGRKPVYIPCRASVCRQMSGRQVKKLEKEYMGKLESRKGCRLLWAMPRHVATGGGLPAPDRGSCQGQGRHGGKRDGVLVEGNTAAGESRREI